MNLRLFMTIGSVLIFISGVSFLLFSAQMMTMYGVTLDGMSIVLAQLLGATMVGFATINWLARGLPQAEGASLRLVLTGNLVSTGLGFVVSLLALLSGQTGINALGWLTVATYLLLALGNAYFLFMPHSRPVAAARV